MLKVTICCDVDPDVLGYNISATRFDVYKEKLGWNGLDNIPKAKEICNSVEDSERNSVRVTWFLRSDRQMKTIFDDYAYPLRNFRDLWKELEQQGDEIGWHPHLWRWSNEKRCWYQEVYDNKWISRCLENGYKEFLKLTPNLTSIRMGWGFHNNFTMKIVNDLGLKVDLSASPRLKYQGGPDERGSSFVNAYDWAATPERPYHPSRADYRRPARNNEQSLNILEIPITTAPKSMNKILVARILGLAPINLRKRVLKGDDIRFRQLQRRYVANMTDPFFKHLATQNFKQAKQNPKKCGSLVAMFHPIELFKHKGFENFENNLKVIEELSRRLSISFSFSTASEMAKVFLQHDTK